ncbi:bifunctional diguanylate cyclase/phosphodiesterase [Dactylosporangium sp. AC04546]|uniref:putative bifunctional diguanylate cyclase/phosphodiesterase n=1 Tax=Dactylosporangium sp. AC04546 TaxID=2862460 RepID=UPI001EDCF4A5|nr:bifunctional diguanylate cyclase/phosphodiesterase [Dactylosporangium sp. AC04546]WVK87734.1 bifunctional diguanylate cyclase/phosphodiesterase [Dactylosporangium sp. AC04546]
MRDRWWLWWTFAGALATAGYFTLPGLSRSLVYDAIGAVSALVMLTAARRNDRTRRLAWLLMAAGTGVWSAGDFVYTYYAHGLHAEPFPSFADVLYLSAYPLMIGGLFLLARDRGRSRAVIVDATIVATGVGLVLWTFVMQPIAQDSTVSVGTRLIALAYPAADVLLLAMVARLLVSGAARDASVRLLVAALGVLLTADIAYSIVSAYTAYNGGLFDAGWLLSYTLWAAAALHPAVRAPGRPPRSTGTRPRLVLLACSSLLAPAMLLVQGLRDPRTIEWQADGIGAGVLFLLVVVRMAGLVREVHTMAMCDELTGLANRRELEHRIRAALGTAAEVALIDLDDFKAINDRLGHGIGDRLLVAVGERLTAAVAPGDTVARLGGDEFAVLLPTAPHGLTAALAEPFTIGPHRLLVRASIGVADCTGTDDPFEPLRRADVAMYAAKVTGGRSARYSPELDARSSEHAQLGAELRVALDEGQFFLVYQPIVALPSARVAGVEALVRWRHPARGLVSPADFVPVAEHNGLIVELGAWLLRESCTRMESWRRVHGARAPEKMSVNVSARQLSEPDFADVVATVLRETGLPASYLALEVTETAVFDSAVALDTLRAVKALGVRIALDDFGTGHSSLGLLRTAPVDILKVDKTFVDDLAAPGAQAAIVTALIDVSNHLGLTAIAEGVETREQAERLVSMGYRYAQGYLFGRPTPDPDFTAPLALAERA